MKWIGCTGPTARRTFAATAPQPTQDVPGVNLAAGAGFLLSALSWSLANCELTVEQCHGLKNGWFGKAWNGAGSGRTNRQQGQPCSSDTLFGWGEQGGTPFPCTPPSLAAATTHLNGSPPPPPRFTPTCFTVGPCTGSPPQHTPCCCHCRWAGSTRRQWQSWRPSARPRPPPSTPPRRRPWLCAPRLLPRHEAEQQ